MINIQNSNKKAALIDIPVALIFFNRSDVLHISFNAIRQARPTKLFLIQDGPRENKASDIEKIMQCRKIVESIDWECELYTDFSEINLGCGMRVYTGISWAFTHVDRLVIIEDDIVVSGSMFMLCAELLERYKDDQRIQMISGMNHLGEYKECPYDYFFSTTGSIWGWATWKRAWVNVDYNFAFLENKYVCQTLKRSLYPIQAGRRLLRDSIKMRHVLMKGSKLSSWSLQHGLATYLNYRLNIIPQKNLTCNIGLTNESVHAVNSIKKIPFGLQRVFFMKTNNLTFPLKHPEFVLNDNNYHDKVNRIMGNNKFVFWSRRIESIIRRLVY